MFKQLLINLTDKLADLSIIVGNETLFTWFFEWNWSLTRPEREQKVREFIRQALRGEGER